MVFPKWAGYLSILGAVLTALTAPEIAAVIGPKLTAALTVALTVVAALSRALVDRDGDGKPDWSL